MCLRHSHALAAGVRKAPRHEIAVGSAERRPKFPLLFDDDLALPDLAQWVAFYGDYDQIPTWAWAEWDRLYEVRQRMQKLSAREPSR